MFAPHISRTLYLDRERRYQLAASKDLSDTTSSGGPLVLTKSGRRIHSQRRWSFTASARQRRHLKRQLHPPVMWNIQGVRGKMPPNCLWHAFQALLIGMLLFSAGIVMSYMGFEADGVFTSNGTAVAGGRAYFYEDARGANVRFSKLSYVGPIIMGVGGFIIVAACVLVFESRDSAAKVGPAAYVTSEETNVAYPVIPRLRPPKKIIDVKTVGTQTIETLSSETLQTPHIFDKRNLVDTFRKLSRTVRQSTSKEDDMHRYPSAPDLCEEEDMTKSSTPKATAIQTRRSSCLPKLKNRVPPAILRQAMSIDSSSSSPFLPSSSGSPTLTQILIPTTSSEPTSAITLGYTQAKTRKGFYRSGTNTSGASDSPTTSREILSPNSTSTSRAVSSLSMDNSCSFAAREVMAASDSTTSNTGTVELHLPNGMVTLNVIQTPGGSMLGGSSTCIRTISPYPSFHSQHDESSSSFDMGSVKSDNIFLSSKSAMKPLRHRSESFGRPTLVRQSKVDQAEVICIPDSDEEQPPPQQQPIPEAEHETDTE